MRKYVDINRPYLQVEQTYTRRPKPPEEKNEFAISDLLRLEVKYPKFQDGIEIPDIWLPLVIRKLRNNLEHALTLGAEIGSYGLRSISPIVPDEGPISGYFGRTRGVSRTVISFSSLFDRLIKLDISKARQELAAWPVDDDTIFCRLRIWASGKAELVSARDFSKTIAGLTDAAFWDDHHQRDLLLVLAKRWKDLQVNTRKKIETRLLSGNAKWDGEDDEKFEERRAWDTLNRLTWLRNNGCDFSFDLESKTNELRQLATTWKPEYATKAAESREGRSFSVQTNTECSALLSEPIKNILSKAYELSGRNEDRSVERNPFSGLSSKYPVRAFTALTLAAKSDNYPEWAWRTFLNSNARKNDKAKFSALIAGRICGYPTDEVTIFIRPLSDWLLSVKKTLSAQSPTVFTRLIEKLISVLQSQPPTGETAIVRENKEPDWSSEAINAPVGKIAEVVFNDPSVKGLKPGDGLPDKLTELLELLLSLKGDLRRYSIAIFTRNLNWLHAIDPEWSESNLLYILDDKNKEDQDAFWSGFFWGSTTPSSDLYSRLKAELLIAATEKGPTRREYCEVLSGMVLAGWGSTDEETQESFITNSEMRDVLLHASEEFRSQVLWQIERWSKSEKNGPGVKWSEMLPKFLRSAWPRQKTIKSPTISARLINIIFSDVNLFADLYEIVLPLLTTIDRDHLMLPDLQNDENNIVDQYPIQTLSLLHAALPNNVDVWPYEIEEILERIREADKTLNANEKFLEIKRKWNSR